MVSSTRTTSPISDLFDRVALDASDGGQFLVSINKRLGLGLTRSMSRGQRRLEALLLIGHIAAIAKRLIGEAAKAQQLELQLISRKKATYHNRAEISVMTLASRVIAGPILMQRIGDPLAHIHRLRSQAANAIKARNSPS